MRKSIFLFVLLFSYGLAAQAQVTTSSISGTVTDAQGQPLIGATVRATHEPSGTNYGTPTNTEGRFVLPNLRIGGPYTVEVTYLGYQPRVYEGINLRLGQPYVLDVRLAQAGTQLREIEIAADQSSIFNSRRTGAATNVGSRQLETLPTISRSITDFTRLTPQANGTSFAGRDARYNNLQVDGANLNNNFGLSNDPLPGGGAQPISLDAYEEVSINIAPYDVRQSGFTGAGINAVTKSGTNRFRGTAYTFYRDQSFNGSRVGEQDISNQIVNASNQIYGGSLSGPIIRNKLFFFVNGEYEQGSRPGVTWSPTGGSGQGNISATPAGDLLQVSNYLRTKFGYETGPFDNFPNFESQNHKLLGKIDWNVSDVHKFTLKYSDFVGTDDVQVNGSSVPNGGGFSVTGRTGTISRLPFNRFSNNSMAFANSNYGFQNIVRTGTAELNSNFQGRMANQLLATISRIRSTRTSRGGVFPTIDIFDGQGNNYIHAGMDPFTNNNDVINNIFSITDNFTYYAGSHTITAGGSYEFQTVGNMFMPASNGYYAFNSLGDLLNDRAPAYFAYTQSLVPGQPAVYSAELEIGQLGVYAQDEINLGNNLNLTVGLRADVPIYHQQPLENPAFSALQFYDENNNLTSYSTGSWPNSRVLLSPRVGFRWDNLQDNTLVLRGGTGVFTGRIPFVYLTNMPTNSGMYQSSGALTSPAQLANIKLTADPSVYADRFPTTAGTAVPRNANIVFIENDFRFPQVFRSNLAADKDLGNGFSLTLEGLFTKDLNAARMRNANLEPTNGIIEEGGLTRPRIVGTGTGGAVTNPNRRLNDDVNTAIVLENTNLGYSTSLTGLLNKAFTGGLYGSLGYTYTLSKEVTANPGSQASSVWNSNPNVGTSNAVELGYSAFAVPHRVVGSLSYRKEYLNHFASTVSIFYSGSNQDNYSFVVNGDLNGDGNSSADLMYIPADRSEMRFEEYTARVNNQNITYTVQQQQDAFDQFINNSPYLRNNRGQFAERNAALLPWYHRMDLRFLQDFFVETGRNNTRHTLQFSADILNVPNLLNSNWGVLKRTITNNPLEFRRLAENSPVYRWQQIGGNLVTEPFQDVISTSSTWSMQLGLRYSF